MQALGSAPGSKMVLSLAWDVSTLPAAGHLRSQRRENVHLVEALPYVYASVVEVLPSYTWPDALREWPWTVAHLDQ